MNRPRHRTYKDCLYDYVQFRHNRIYHDANVWMWDPTFDDFTNCVKWSTYVQDLAKLCDKEGLKDKLFQWFWRWWAEQKQKQKLCTHDSHSNGNQ